MAQDHILVCGSIAYDNIMQFNGDMNDNLTSDKQKHVFNLSVMPFSKTVNYGGTAGNISYNLGLLNAKTMVMTAVGRDFNDSGYKSHFNQLSSLKFIGETYQDLFTAACYIVNDKNHNQMIVFHQGAMERCPQLKLTERGVSKDKIKIASISPDNYIAMMNWVKELKTLGIPFIFDPGQVTPAFNEKDLKQIIPQAEIVIGNEFEIEMIQKKMNINIDQLQKLNSKIIMTKGAKGSVIYQNGKEQNISVVKPEKVVDTTGAGDGYRAGLLYGLVNNLNLVEACQIGAVVGSYVVETEGPQTQKFSIDSIKKRYLSTFGKAFPI